MLHASPIRGTPLIYCLLKQRFLTMDDFERREYVTPERRTMPDDVAVKISNMSTVLEKCADKHSNTSREAIQGLSVKLVMIGYNI